MGSSSAMGSTVASQVCIWKTSKPKLPTFTLIGALMQTSMSILAAQQTLGPKRGLFPECLFTCTSLMAIGLERKFTHTPCGFAVIAKPLGTATTEIGIRAEANPATVRRWRMANANPATVEMSFCFPVVCIGHWPCLVSESLPCVQGLQALQQVGT